MRVANKDLLSIECLEVCVKMEGGSLMFACVCVGIQPTGGWGHASQENFGSQFLEGGLGATKGGGGIHPCAPPTPTPQMQPC